MLETTPRKQRARNPQGRKKKEGLLTLEQLKMNGKNVSETDVMNMIFRRGHGTVQFYIYYDGRKAADDDDSVYHYISTFQDICYTAGYLTQIVVTDDYDQHKENIKLHNCLKIDYELRHWTGLVLGNVPLKAIRVKRLPELTEQELLDFLNKTSINTETDDVEIVLTSGR